MGNGLADGSPVDVGFAELAEACPEDVVLLIALVGVGGDDGLGCVAGEGEDLSVAGEIGYLEVECHA